MCEYQTGKIKGLKFGDVVINYWASEENPHRKGIFVRYKKKDIELTDGDGNFWDTVNDSESRFRKV